MWEKSLKSRSNTPRKKINDQVVRDLSSIIGHEDNFEITMDMESKFLDLITSESNKNVMVVAEKDNKDVMRKQFLIRKYEQIIPDWSAFLW